MNNLGGDLAYLGVPLTNTNRTEKPSTRFPKSALTAGAVAGYPHVTCDSGRIKGENFHHRSRLLLLRPELCFLTHRQCEYIYMNTYDNCEYRHLKKSGLRDCTLNPPFHSFSFCKDLSTQEN